MSLGVERVVAPTMTCLLKLWREEQSGTTRQYESVAFLTIMEQNPQFFFSAMADERKVFREWLGELEGTFVWPLDPPCPLETRRKQLIAMLERTYVGPGAPTMLKNAVAKKLSTIRCRQIE